MTDQLTLKDGFETARTELWSSWLKVRIPQVESRGLQEPGWKRSSLNLPKINLSRPLTLCIDIDKPRLPNFTKNLMKRYPGLMLFIAALSVMSGYLLSKASFVGRAGMSLFYREYNFLKTWWKGGLLVFISLMLVYLLHGLIQKKYEAGKARSLYIMAGIFGIVGLYFTYNDFRHTLSHRLLGERFHLGAYLFWIGWIVISCFYLLRPVKNPNQKEVSVPQTLN